MEIFKSFYILFHKHQIFNIMKTQILKSGISILIVLAFMVMNVSAQKRQPKGDMKQKMTEQQASFMVKKLGLNEEESQKFMPVYNEYKVELQKNRAAQQFDFSKELSDKDAEAQLNAMLNMRAKEIEIQRAYIRKFRAVIPASKIGMVFRSEKEYKQGVMKNIKKRNQHHKKDKIQDKQQENNK